MSKLLNTHDCTSACDRWRVS